MKTEKDAPDPNPKSPFDKFSELAKQVVNTPKEEVQKREEEWQRERKASSDQKRGPTPHSR